MPRAPRICPKAGCTNTQPCATHAKAPWVGSQSNGFSARKRQIILARDSMCRRCGQAPSTIADHIIPVAEGGTHSIDNGQGLCGRCDRVKTAEDSERGQRRARRGTQGDHPLPPEA